VCVLLFFLFAPDVSFTLRHYILLLTEKPSLPGPGQSDRAGRVSETVENQIRTKPEEEEEEEQHDPSHTDAAWKHTSVSASP